MISPAKRLAAALAVVAALAPLAAPAWSQDGGREGSVVRVDLAAQSAQARIIAIPKGKSAMVELPVDARDVLVTNPQVADALLRSPRSISILGVTPGQTDAVFFDAAGRRILALNIRVDQDFSAVAQTINRILPGSTVHVEGINNGVVLSGGVASASDADKAVQIAQQFTARPDQVVNLLSIAGKEQVLLKVRIVEVQRSSLKQLGFNLSATLGQLGGPQYLLAQAATWGVNGALLGGITAGGSIDTTQAKEMVIPCANGLTGTCYTKTPTYLYTNPTTGVTSTQTISNWNTATNGTSVGSPGLNKGSGAIQAFERVGLVRTLAEPSLTTVSGEAAKFLAGGEFPVPTGEDNTGKVTVDFKPYGVGLGFTPVVLSGGRISLKLSTEVSELTNQGAFALAAGGQTLTIPGLNVRRAETTVELPSGGAMMIAGLLKEETKQDLDSLPGLMNLPVLGALFRSRDYQEGETELVIIVTPYIVQPTSPDKLQTPADGLKLAGDIETNLLGHMNKTYKAPPEADAAARSYQGPVGYVIE